MTHQPPGGWGDDKHPVLDQLAELDEGLLAPDEAAGTQAHVAGCADCRAQQAQLERVRTLLGSLPPEPLPAEVATRLDAVLDEGVPPASSTIVPLARPRRRWRMHPTAAGLGAAAAVAALVAALVVGHHSGRGKSTPDQTSAAGGTAASGSVLDNLQPTTSGTDYTTGNLASTVPALVSAPHLAMQPATPAAGGGAAAVKPNTKAAAGTAVATVPAALSRLFHSQSALQTCVQAVEAGGPTSRPLAIDFARYQGAPAVLVVLPGLSAGNLDAWFVGPACGASDDAHLLGYKAIPASASPPPGG